MPCYYYVKEVIEIDIRTCHDFGLDLTKINQNPKKHLPLFFGFKERLVAPLFPPFPTLMLSLGTS